MGLVDFALKARWINPQNMNTQAFVFGDILGEAVGWDVRGYAS